MGSLIVARSRRPQNGKLSSRRSVFLFLPHGAFSAKPYTHESATPPQSLLLTANQVCQQTQKPGITIRAAYCLSLVRRSLVRRSLGVGGLPILTTFPLVHQSLGVGGAIQSPVMPCMAHKTGHCNETQILLAVHALPLPLHVQPHHHQWHGH